MKVEVAVEQPGHEIERPVEIGYDANLLRELLPGGDVVGEGIAAREGAERKGDRDGVQAAEDVVDLVTMAVAFQVGGNGLNRQGTEVVTEVRAHQIVVVLDEAVVREEIEFQVVRVAGHEPEGVLVHLFVHADQADAESFVRFREEHGAHVHRFEIVDVVGAGGDVVDETALGNPVDHQPQCGPVPCQGNAHGGPCTERGFAVPHRIEIGFHSALHGFQAGVFGNVSHRAALGAFAEQRSLGTA